MRRIGVTGHRGLPDVVLPLVRAGIRAELGAGAVEALSCLAAGTDQLFATIALDCGVPVTAVIPGVDGYAERLGDKCERIMYRRLLASCTTRVDLPLLLTHEEAYYAAGQWIVDHADRLVAVWDGLPARGLGGTGDVVAYARLTGVPVKVLWSPGATRPRR